NGPPSIRIRLVRSLPYWTRSASPCFAGSISILKNGLGIGSSFTRKNPVGITVSHKTQRHQESIEQRVPPDCAHELAEPHRLGVTFRQHTLHQFPCDRCRMLAEHGGNRSDHDSGAAISKDHDMKSVVVSSSRSVAPNECYERSLASVTGWREHMGLLQRDRWDRHITKLDRHIGPFAIGMR